MTSDSSCTTMALLNDVSSNKEVFRNHVSSLKKRCKPHPRYYICLGALVHAVNKQIENKHVRNDPLHLFASRYAKQLREWIYRYKYKELFTNYMKSLIASIALFAIGIKLTTELAAWKL